MTDEPPKSLENVSERGDHRALLAVAMVLNRPLTEDEKRLVVEYLESASPVTFAGAIRAVAGDALTPWEAIVYDGMFSSLVISKQGAVS